MRSIAPSARRTATRALALGALVLAVAACSDDEGDASPATTTATATAVTTAALATTTSTAVADRTYPSRPPPTAATTSTSVRPTSTTTAAAYDFSAVGPIVQGFVDQHGLNGAGLIVVDRDDGVVDEQYWGEFGPDRISLVASSSKMITAGVLLRLQDDGLLDIDAPVADGGRLGRREPDDHASRAAVEQLGSRRAAPEPGLHAVRLPVPRRPAPCRTARRASSRRPTTTPTSSPPTPSSATAAPSGRSPVPSPRSRPARAGPS